MSKVEAYICDKCNQLKRADEVAGLKDTQDLFDPIGKSFPTLPNNPEKTSIHFCLECYRINVLIPAENHTNRKTDEAGYQRIMREIQYAFKTGIITIFNQKNSKFNKK